MKDFTHKELLTVVTFLQTRADNLKNWHMQHEYGDDFAHSNGKWDIIKTLKSEESGIRRTLDFARDRLKEKANEEEKNWQSDH